MTTLVEYKILGSLLDGLKCFREIASAGRWNTVRQNFYQYSRPMLLAGWIEKRPGASRRDACGRINGSRDSIYSLTELGQAELARFQGDPAVACARRLPVPRNGVLERTPTRSEWGKLIGVAPASERLLFRAVIERTLFFDEIISIEFRRVERALECGWIVFPSGPRTGRKIPLTESLAQILRDATRSRLDSPLFPTRRGKNWSPQSSSKGLIEVLTATGLSQTVGWKVKGRRPTEKDEQRFLPIAGERFRLWYLARKHKPADLRVGDLAAIRVRDVDIEKWTIAGRSISGKFLETVKNAYDSRLAGRLFLNAAGCSWRRPKVEDAFREARSAAGLPSNVKMLGRRETWRARTGGTTAAFEKHGKRIAANYAAAHAQRAKKAKADRERCLREARKLRESISTMSVRAISKRLATSELSENTIRRYLAGLDADLNR